MANNLPNWWGTSYLPYDNRDQERPYDSSGGGTGDAGVGGGGGNPRSTGGGPGKGGPGTVNAPPTTAGAPGASPAGGPAGVGGTGGYGFVNLGQYLYANPNTTGMYAPNPGGGATVGNLNTGSTSNANGGVQYTPTGSYTAGMAGVDNALNSVYGRTSSAAGGPASSGGGGSPGHGHGRSDDTGGGPVEGGGGDRGTRSDSTRGYRNIYGMMGGR